MSANEAYRPEKLQRASWLDDMGQSLSAYVFAMDFWYGIDQFADRLFRLVWTTNRRSRSMFGHFRAGDDGRSNLAENVSQRVWSMWDKNRIGVVVCCDFLQRVEILRHQDQLHHVLRRGTGHRLRKVFYRVLQTSYDRLSLIRNAFPLKSLRFGFCFRLLHEQ
jgi:hypothetical protein